MTRDEPTDEMPGGPDDLTEVTPVADEPTTTRLDSAPPPPPPPPVPPREGPAPTDRGKSRGIGLLVGAVVASLLLVGVYLAAGGPVGPDKVADPCDPRPWTDPGNLEESAQQFALSAADGAACELGVSREELTRAIADDQARQDFMEAHGISDSDLEDALRAGLNRAVDDAENAGALDGTKASLARLAIKIMPMSAMIALLENADSIFNGDFASLGDFGDAIGAITGGLSGADSGTTDDPLGSLGDAIEKALPEGTADDLEQLIPEDTRKQLEEQAKEALKQGSDDLFGP